MDGTRVDRRRLDAPHLFVSSRRGRSVTRQHLHLGIDIGTQGARALAVTVDGTVRARGEFALPVPAPGPKQEQQPEEWWQAMVGAVRALGDARDDVVSMAVSCTSGSVCALDDSGNAVGPGLLYADRRAVVTEGTDASWAVAKIAWLVAEGASLVPDATSFTSPGGYVASRLMGASAPIDVTQALKFGFDPALHRWGSLPVGPDRLPEVVDTGRPIGVIDGDAAAATGLPVGVVVVAGATDGVAGHLACAPTPQRWAVAIGSTIVWKAMSDRRIDVPGVGIYSHRGPDGWWFPGAASNAGGRVLSTWADPARVAELSERMVVTPAIDAVYPSVVPGERFPFVDPDFRPVPFDGRSETDRFAAEVAGLAFVERWGCEELVGHGCVPPTSIATTGGVVASESVTRLRADVLQLPIEVPAEPSSAFGAAIVAAAPAHGGVLDAARAMVDISRRIEPCADDRWASASRRFRERIVQAGKEPA
ncbi:MAG: hypothetical protein FGM58_07835 [Acidimicrobiia bacterium]|nr:hypothetical protein [Acidimicrobiia bacterium]